MKIRECLKILGALTNKKSQKFQRRLINEL